VLAEQLREKTLLALLEEQVASVFGKKIVVSIEVAENGAERPAEALPAPARSEGGLEERAKRDPLVKRFVDTFQGEVEDIISSDGSR
jgi:hypothetical protein